MMSMKTTIQLLNSVISNENLNVLYQLAIITSYMHCGQYITDTDAIINNQVLRKIKIVVKSDVKNWAYISLR